MLSLVNLSVKTVLQNCRTSNSQGTYNVTLRRVRADTDAMGKQYYIFWVCVCSLSYPACNMHAPYCHLWPLRRCYIFTRNLIHGKIL